MSAQLRVTNTSDGSPAALTVFGSLTFVKGLSQTMTAADAEAHKRTLEAIDANADVKVEPGQNRPPFRQRYTVEVIDPDAKRAEAHAAFEAAQAAEKEAAPVTVPDGTDDE